METQKKKLGRPRRPPKTPEEIEAERLKVLESQKRSRAKKKALAKVQETLASENVEDIIREIVEKPLDNFEQLRPLALKAVREVLKKGNPRERLTAANIVLNRTDPERRTVEVSVEIHPVDLSAFRCLPKQSECIEGEFTQIPEETSGTEFQSLPTNVTTHHVSP